MNTAKQEIIPLRIPVPIPLKYVNVYLCHASDGWRIIDTGLDTQEAREIWQQSLKQHNIAFQDIVEIIITHFHPDHIGLAGWLHEKTGAPVRISEVGKQTVPWLWSPEQPQASALHEFFIGYGMPAEQAQDLKQHMIDFMKYISPLPPLTAIKPGEALSLAGEEAFIAIDTPGHCDGHLAFLGEKTGRLIAGDQILMKISPNVSLWPNFDPHPLQSFITSLKELRQLPISQVFPGHGPIFTEVKQRIDQLLDHHEERLQEVYDIVKTNGATTAYRICMQLFSHRQLDLHQLRFAMAEGLAHLIYLEEQGSVERNADHLFVVRE